MNSSVEEKLLKAIGEISLGLAVVYFEGSRETYFITLFLIGSMCSKLEDDFGGQLLLQIYFEGSYAWGGTIEGAIDEVLWIEMFEDNFISKVNHLSPFLVDVRPELLLLCFCSRGGLCFLQFIFLTVHFIVYFERTFGQDLEEWLSVVIDIDHITASWWQKVLFVVDLKVEVGIGVAEC